MTKLAFVSVLSTYLLVAFMVLLTVPDSIPTRFSRETISPLTFHRGFFPHLELSLKQADPSKRVGRFCNRVLASSPRWWGTGKPTRMSSEVKVAWATRQQTCSCASVLEASFKTVPVGVWVQIKKTHRRPFWCSVPPVKLWSLPCGSFQLHLNRRALGLLLTSWIHRVHSGSD